MEKLMLIGEAARATGISAKIIRHYEQAGLLPSVQRARSGYHVYGDTDLHRLHIIRSARVLGVSLAEIRSLLDLWDDQSRHSADVIALAQKHIDDLDARIARTRDMAGTLKTHARACAGHSRPDCPILNDLQSHSDHR